MTYPPQFLTDIRHSRQAWLAYGGAEAGLLILGATLPIAQITEFWLFDTQISILGIGATLLSSGEILLAFVVLGFGFVFPMIKIILGMRRRGMRKDAGQHAVSRTGRAQAFFQKFSMVDVFLLSFLVYGSKISETYEVSLGIGAYFLMASIALSFFKPYLLANADQPR